MELWLILRGSLDRIWNGCRWIVLLGIADRKRVRIWIALEFTHYWLSRWIGLEKWRIGLAAALSAAAQELGDVARAPRRVFNSLTFRIVSTLHPPPLPSGSPPLLLRYGNASLRPPPKRRATVAPSQVPRVTSSALHFCLPIFSFSLFSQLSPISQCKQRGNHGQVDQVDHGSSDIHSRRQTFDTDLPPRFGVDGFLNRTSRKL